ncbi:MAG: tRNA-dihydrouridine synthase [Polyangiaceae bacterium]
MNEPFRLKGLTLKNRVLRSSLGGQLCAPNGAVTDMWTNFESRFARSGVAALVSATVSVSGRRYAPLHYPNLASDAHVERLRRALHTVKSNPRAGDCAYILQIGDPGYHTQTSLFPQAADAKSASFVFDFLYGYSDHAVAMTAHDIDEVVAAYAAGARRARAAGCDGLEVTASKGYLLQQFLSPITNRRDDAYGGTREKRFHLLERIVRAVRDEVGPDYLFGVRISVEDAPYWPVNLRVPLRSFFGNRLDDTLWFAERLERLGVDYLHLSNGFGFINPTESPGDFPLAEVRRVYNATRHLGTKARLRSTLMNLVPTPIAQRAFSLGWGTRGGARLGMTGEQARKLRGVVKIPLIANGGFQNRSLIEETLASGACDLVSMARPLLANPDLFDALQKADSPPKPCIFCNRCSVLTAIVPVGCYEPKRFADQDEMERQILSFTSDPDAPSPNLPD